MASTSKEPTVKNNSKKSLAAQVDIHKVKYTKPANLGIDFTNEIDIWSKMEFRYREQIKNLGKHRTLEGHDILRGPNSLIYSLREQID